MRNERKCKICKETIKASNLSRHEKVCKIPKGKYKRNEGFQKRLIKKCKRNKDYFQRIVNLLVRGQQRE